jgi:RHS repeat-associated protein
LKQKQLHSEFSGSSHNPFIQKTDYLYNIRGWLTSVNNPETAMEENDIFAMQLQYHDSVVNSGDPVQYNGNITSVKWATNLNKERYGYDYSYDEINRLTHATFYKSSGEGFMHDGSFDERNISYDPNGNLLTLHRFTSGAIPIDKLRYSYLSNGNQLGYIVDSTLDVSGVIDYPGGTSTTPGFAYDLNGNMVISADKGMNDSIRYSYLNMPELLDFGNGEKIKYIYDGNGQKVAKLVMDGNALPGSSLIYAGNFVYDWNGDLQYILMGEGRIVYEESGFRFEYFMKDHLGNTRATYAQAAPGLPQVAEYRHYYPFGMQLETLGYSSGFDLPNNYRYNGKELQTDYGLEWYDYGARFYDPQLGRFHSVDPLAHKPKNVSISPYAYTGNNPISRIDPDGRDWFYYQSQGEKKKSWHWQEGDVAKYTNTKGKEVTTKRGYDYLVTFKATGKNNEGAVTGTLQVWGDRNPNKGALTTVNGAFTGGGSYNFNPTQSGNYLINLSQRDSKGPQAMNAAKDNPVAYMGIQLIPNRYISEGGYRYDVGGAYGAGRIRLLETDGNMNISQSQVHGYYIHGKYDSHNWTHGCMCDKSGNIFNYFWSGAGKDIRGYVPVSVEY